MFPYKLNFEMYKMWIFFHLQKKSVKQIFFGQKYKIENIFYENK